MLTLIEGDVANDPQWQPGHGLRLPPNAQSEPALRGAAYLAATCIRRRLGSIPVTRSARRARGRVDVTMAQRR